MSHTYGLCVIQALSDLDFISPTILPHHYMYMLPVQFLSTATLDIIHVQSSNKFELEPHVVPSFQVSPPFSCVY